MAELETTATSTPVESGSVDTSQTSELVNQENLNLDTTNTSDSEPTQAQVTAEETIAQDGEDAEEKQEKLYANKYKSVEELEKGYNEAQKFISKANEFEKKYNELIAKNQEIEQKAQQEALLQAREQGFNSIDEQHIAQQLAVSELEYYVNNLYQVNPEYSKIAHQNLVEYFNTGNLAYLNEAKKYFPSNCIENITLQKNALENKLKNEIRTREAQQRELAEKQLADVIKTDFSDFMADLKENEGKRKALESYCNLGLITSKEDMQTFQDIYSLIEKKAKEDGVKEYLANLAVEETKSKAQFGTGSPITTTSGLKEFYTAQDIGRMSQSEYDSLYNKYGYEFEKRIR